MLKLSVAEVFSSYVVGRDLVLLKRYTCFYLNYFLKSVMHIVATFCRHNWICTEKVEILLAILQVGLFILDISLSVWFATNYNMELNMTSFVITFACAEGQNMQ